MVVVRTFRSACPGRPEGLPYPLLKNAVANSSVGCPDSGTGMSTVISMELPRCTRTERNRTEPLRVRLRTVRDRRRGARARHRAPDRQITVQKKPPACAGGSCSYNRVQLTG